MKEKGVKRVQGLDFIHDMMDVKVLILFVMQGIAIIREYAKADHEGFLSGRLTELFRRLHRDS